MRSTIANGMVLRSVDEPTPEAEDSLTQRMPSTSTSTRLEPRWRKSTCAEPAPTPLPSGGKPKLPDELNLALSAEPEAVSSCNTSPIEVSPVRSISARLSVWIGTWPCNSAVLMRVPVTCTLSSVRVLGAGSGCCAQASEGIRHNDNCTARHDRREPLKRFILSLSRRISGNVTARPRALRSMPTFKRNLNAPQPGDAALPPSSHRHACFVLPTERVPAPPMQRVTGAHARRRRATFTQVLSHASV